MKSGCFDIVSVENGKFFALSEGWADDVGDTYAAIKYGNGQFQEITWNTEQTALLYNQVNTYLFHLENNPTFYNSFIPRGLFFDLTDVGSNEDFDNIDGFNINNIYSLFNPSVNTIQKFRDSWEVVHPNANNALLFDHYNVD